MMFHHRTYSEEKKDNNNIMYHANTSTTGFQQFCGGLLWVITNFYTILVV